MKIFKRCCVLGFVCLMMSMPGYVRAYDVVGVFLNFPQGDLDGVDTINVQIAPYPFSMSDEIGSYPPAYKTNLNYIHSVFADYTGDDFQGALGADWSRDAYSNGVQSYTRLPDGTDTLLSRDASGGPGGPTIVDGYVYEDFPAATGIALDGYTGSVQTRMVLIESNVPVSVSFLTVYVNFWQWIAEPDDTPPVIYLFGEPADDALEWPVNIAYENLGVTAEDNVDGEIALSNFDISYFNGSGDPIAAIATDAAIGTTYSVEYSVADAMGNESDLRTRTVTIGEDRAPVIYLNGAAADDSVNAIRGRTYVDQGVVAIDDVYDISDQIVTRIDGVIGGPADIDTSTSGVSYVITYDVSDYLDQAAETRQRTVTVVDPPSGGGGGGGCFISTILPR